MKSLESRILSILEKKQKGSITLKEGLELSGISKYQYSKTVQESSVLRNKLLEIKESDRRLSQSQIELILEMSRQDIDLKDILSKLKIPYSRHLRTRNSILKYKKDLERIRKQRDKREQDRFLEILDQRGGNLINAYTESKYSKYKIKSWFKKPEFKEVKDRILKKHKTFDRNTNYNSKNHRYRFYLDQYNTPHDKDVIKVLNRSKRENNGCFKIDNNPVADVCRTCNNVYLIENFYYNRNSSTKHQRHCMHCVNERKIGRGRNRRGYKRYTTNEENYILNIYGNIVGYKCKNCKEKKRTSYFSELGPKKRICNDCIVTLKKL